MESFWRGFEKQAKDKKKKKKYTARDKLKGVALGTLGVAAANTAAGTLLPVAVAIDPKLTAGEARSIIGEANKGVKRPILPTLVDIWPQTQGGYDPINHTIWSDSRAGILAHEYGHAKSIQGPWDKVGPITKIRTVMGGSPFLLGGAVVPLIASLSDNETVRENAPYAALLSAPRVLEEAGASLTGLNTVRKSLGFKRMLRATPGLAAALGTYLSLPLGGAYAAKKIIEHRKEKEADS